MAEQRKSVLAPLVFLAAMVIALVLIVIGVYHYRMYASYSFLLSGVLAAVLTLVGYAVTTQIAHALTRACTTWEELNSTFVERMEQFSVMLNLISEQQLISERAKAVAFRDKDHEALHRAIREEMARGQYDAALLLVADMESAFGYKQEADQIRAEIAQLRDTAIRRIVTEAVSQIDRDCSAEKWDQALEMADRLAAAYPGHETTVTLRQQVLQRKDGVKQMLLQRWREAVARKDIDGSIGILRQLDIYVTGEEVAQLRDGALEIFKARIERLRERFKKHVQDKNWAEAIEVGQDILTDFPTSKLAQEVRDMMEMLQERRSEGTTTAATS